jgi:hypothetical protein
VRPSAALTVEFVQSIKASGVITPVLARRDEHGNVLVRAGQRRTLGAREAGVANQLGQGRENERGARVRCCGEVLSERTNKERHGAARGITHQPRKGRASNAKLKALRVIRYSCDARPFAV